MKNPIFIKQIQLKNYRTYKDTEIHFTQNIQTLVGPNECGKTNLLLAFELFNNPLFLQESDICCYVDQIFGTTPEIEFKLNDKFIPELKLDPNIKNLSIKFKENKRTIRIPSFSSQTDLKYTISIKGNLPTGQIHITHPELVKGLKLPENHHIDENKQYSFTTNSKETLDSILNYLNAHDKKAQINFGVTEDSSNASTPIKINDILEEIKIINWAFKPEYYIPSVIPLSNLQTNSSSFKSIENFFKITEINLKDFINSTDHNRRKNILREVNSKVSTILNNSWTQYQDVKLDLSLGTDNALHVGFLENERTIDPKRRSLGFQWFFAFLLNFNANFGIELKDYIILLDEPGILLHPGGQKDLLKEIEKLAIYNQIIYTTHLPFMINRNHPERIIYLSKKDGLTVLKEPRKEGIFDDVLLAYTLGFNFSSISNFGEINLFVEGITDKLLIEKLSINYSQKLNNDLLDLNYISIIPINGIENLDSFIRVSQEINLNFLVLMDDDKNGKKMFNKYMKSEAKGKIDTNRFFKLSDNCEIEDLIPFSLVKEGFQEIRKNVEPWKSLIKPDFNIKDEKIGKQLKNLINEIKQNTDITKFNLTPGRIKLDLILAIKNLITEDNCEDFGELINILKKINLKSFEILKELRNR